MTETQWNSFACFRSEFKTQCAVWNERFQTALQPLQAAAAAADTPSYPLETAVVYNTALDEVTAQDDIRLIVIGDNPGKDEQRAQNRRYLVGQSGKIADGFFRREPELRIDFRKNVVILNKTPVHTAKTAHLKYVRKHGSPEITQLLLESQLWMARSTARLHQTLCSAAAPGETCALWLVGYAELKGNGIFLPYRDQLRGAYRTDTETSDAWRHVFVFQHFSMNRFLIDLKDYRSRTAAAFPCEATAENRHTLAHDLAALGTLHRTEIFGA